MRFAPEFTHPKTRLYYQIALRAIDLDAAVTRLLRVFADTRPERPAARGRAVLAVVIVDRQGRPVDQSTTALSSFGWGVPRALAGALEGLARWPEAERTLAGRFDATVRHDDGEGNVLPLGAGLIRRAFELLVSALAVPGDLVEAPSFTNRSYQHYKNPDPPEPLLLNSFFLGDLAAAGDLFRRGAATPNLQRYLGASRPATRRDLLLGRRQTSGRHPAPAALSRRLWSRTQARTARLTCQGTLSRTRAGTRTPSASSRRPPRRGRRGSRR